MEKVSKIPENLDIKCLRLSKTDFSKETKKKFLEKILYKFRSSRMEVFCKKGKKLKKIHRKTAQVPAQMFSCEFCEIYKNTYFVEHLRTAAFGNILLKHNDAKKQ